MHCCPHRSLASPFHEGCSRRPLRLQETLQRGNVECTSNHRVCGHTRLSRAKEVVPRRRKTNASEDGPWGPTDSTWCPGCIRFRLGTSASSSAERGWNSLGDGDAWMRHLRGCMRTKPRLQERPRLLDGTEDPTAWPASWGRPSGSGRRLPRLARARRESHSEPAGGAESPWQERQTRGAGTARATGRGVSSRAAPGSGARPSAGSSSRGISFAAQQKRHQLNRSALGASAFFIPCSVQQPPCSWA